MNELIKNIPTFMCHIAFVDEKLELVKMNGSDIDLFWVLVFVASESYYFENVDKKDDETKIVEFAYNLNFRT